MSFVHSYISTADEKPLQENEEKAVKIEGLEKRIEVLESVNKKLADHNRELKDQVCVYEQRNVVPSGVGKADDTTREFERLGIQETAENFVENFREKEKESLNVKCEMLEKANQYLTEENGKLKKELDHHKKLNTRSKKMATSYIALQAENKMLKKTVEHYKAVEKDYKDGASMVEEKKFSEQVGLPDLAGFRNPFNCAVSCVPSVVYFIFHKMNLRVCNKRFIMEMHCTLREVPEAACAVGNCSLSFQDFYNVGLIKETPALCKEIIDANKTEGWLQEAIETMEGESHPALFMMYYKENEDGKKRAGHCMAIMPDGTFIDVQMKQIWEPKHDKRLKSVNLIEVWKIERKAAKDWEEKCGLIKCEIECMMCASDRSECSSELN